MKAKPTTALELARAALAAAETALGAARNAYEVAAVALHDASTAFDSSSPEQPEARRQARIARDDCAELCELRNSQLNEAMAAKDAAIDALKEVIRAEWYSIRDAARARLEKAILELVPDFWNASLNCGSGFANLQFLLADIARGMQTSPNWETAQPHPELDLVPAAPDRAGA